MHRTALLIVVALLSVSAGHTAAPAARAIKRRACSCPHFCMCYFNAHPAAHHENGKTEHFCKFINAYKVNKGAARAYRQRTRERPRCVPP